MRTSALSVQKTSKFLVCLHGQGGRGSTIRYFVRRLSGRAPYIL